MRFAILNRIPILMMNAVNFIFSLSDKLMSIYKNNTSLASESYSLDRNTDYKSEIIRANTRLTFELSDADDNFLKTIMVTDDNAADTITRISFTGGFFNGAGQTTTSIDSISVYYSNSQEPTKVVFLRDAGNETNDICVIDADGNNFSRLTTIADAYGDPSFSPDGTKILLVRYGITRSRP